MIKNQIILLRQVVTVEHIDTTCRHSADCVYRVTQKKREHWKNPTKIEEIQEKKILTEIEPLQLAFEEKVIQIINV